MFQNRYLSNYGTSFIELKPSLFARLGRNYTVKVSLKIQTNNSFARIINRKIQIRYIGVNILDSLSRLKKLFFKYLASRRSRVPWSCDKTFFHHALECPVAVARACSFIISFKQDLLLSRGCPKS